MFARVRWTLFATSHSHEFPGLTVFKWGTVEEIVGINDAAERWETIRTLLCPISLIRKAMRQ